MSDLSSLAADLPACAAACLFNIISESSCSLADQACICSNENITAQAIACVGTDCTVREALFTRNLTATTCGVAPRVDHSYISVSYVFLGLSAVAVLLRLAARLQAKVPMWWDDLIISLSFLGCVAFTLLALLLKNKGLGTDIWAVTPGHITLTFKHFYALFILYITSRDLVRLSILLFYQRIFGQINIVRRLIQFTFALIIACALAFDLAIIFACTPISRFWHMWDGEHNEGQCISTHAIFWAGAVIVTIIDVWIMLIPLPFIARVKLPIRQKILSGIMFTFGILVVIVSLYRLTTINRFTLSKNPTYDFVDVGIWSGLELYVGIICACLPHFYNLLKPLFKWIGSSSKNSTQGANGLSNKMGSSSSAVGRQGWRQHDGVTGTKMSGSTARLGTASTAGMEVEETELVNTWSGETRGSAWA